MGSAVYPVIEEPRKQPDGSYVVRVHRGPGDTEERTAPDLKKARELMVALQNAAALLVPRPAPSGPIRPAHRPSLLTPEVKARLLEGFSECMTYDMIAALAGISQRTLTRWLEDGRRALEVWEDAPEDYEEPERDRLHREFFLDARQAEAEKQRQLIRGMTGPRADPAWPRFATFLERRWYKDFARRWAKDEETPESLTVVFRRPPMREVQGDTVERQTAAPPAPPALAAVK